MTKTSPTIAEALASCRSELAAAGIDSARRDAEVLVTRLLDIDRAALYTHEDRRLDGEATRRLRDWTARRLYREPVAYITGVREFWSLELEVNRDVLIPRPETELLVEVCLDRAGATDPERLVDVGTGSGAVVAALASELRDTDFVATDVSPGALDVARRNLARLGFIDRTELRLGDLYEPLDPARPFDVIVSNPPYVPDGDVPRLMADVRDWEPMTALLGGDDGLRVIRRLIRGAPRHLRTGGCLLLEIGAEQGLAVHALLEAAGFSDIDIVPDLGGLDRVAVGRYRR